jgi:predicted ATPase
LRRRCLQPRPALFSRTHASARRAGSDEPDRSVGRRQDPFGGDFLEEVARTPEKTRAARLRRIRDALRVAVPQLKELELDRDVRGTPHLRGKYEHWRPQGAWQNEAQFSDGTLRLLGLLWAALDGSGALLMEEPEQSLHPEVVRFLPQMFARIQRKSGRQVLLSTHSTDSGWRCVRSKRGCWLTAGPWRHS